MAHVLVGTVCSGSGKAGRHLREHAQELARYLDEPPVPGTLNLVLRQPVGFDFQQVALVCDRRFFSQAAEVVGIPALAYRWLDTVRSTFSKSWRLSC